MERETLAFVEWNEQMVYGYHIQVSSIRSIISIEPGGGRMDI